MTNAKKRKLKIKDKGDKGAKAVVEYDFSDVKERLKHSPYGTTWLLVYGKFWAFVMALLVTLSIVFTCFQRQGYYEIMTGDAPVSYKLVLTIALASIIIIIAIVAYLYVGFKKLTPNCFLWNKIFLYIYPIPYSLGKALEQMNQYGGKIWFYSLMFGLSTSLFCMFNFVYFENRKYLFDQSVKPEKRPIVGTVIKDMAITVALVVIISLLSYLCLDRVMA